MRFFVIHLLRPLCLKQLIVLVGFSNHKLRMGTNTSLVEAPCRSTALVGRGGRMAGFGAVGGGGWCGIGNGLGEWA